MKRAAINLLTLSLVLTFSSEIFASILIQEQAKTHLRWNLFAEKDHLVINKKGNTVLIKTLNSALFDNVQKELQRIAVPDTYIRKVDIIPPREQNNVSVISLTLKSSDVELFTFYKERDKKYVLDFWEEADEINSQKAAVQKAKVSTHKGPKVAKKAVAAVKAPEVKKLPPVLKRPAPKKKSAKKKKDFRDFRYGAAFIWDYKTFEPEIKLIVNLERKTPEYFYEIKNRPYNKNEKESHLQLTINLYRKKKWGLMYKSIKLYHEKYGEDDNVDFNEYLKANAILRENFEKGNREPVKMAMSMLSNIAERTGTYELKKGIIKYLLTYSLQGGEYVESLKHAKKYYVITKENFDYEESKYAAEAILHSLTRLNQISKVRELLKEKTIVKILPKQLMMAYQIYIYHKLGDMDKVIQIYEKNKQGLAKPVDQTILFNTAEAYFRTAAYDKAIKTFDDFLSQHSYTSRSSHARLRIALAYELTDKNIKETLALYKNAINRSSVDEVSFEAKIRYVALRSIRKFKLDEFDREVRVFLELDKNKKKQIDKNLRKLLWLVRLRTFIVDHDYDKALAYLQAIPLTAFTPAERRVFESDGAEIAYGIMNQFYESGEYSKVIKAWEIYKKKYVKKVANDVYLNFIVGRSFLKLGLYDGFDRIYSDFVKLGNTPKRTFPIWIERKNNGNTSEIIEELGIIKNIRLKNWELVEKGIERLSKEREDYNKVNYYRGLLFYKKREYFSAAQNFEVFLANQREKTLFDPEEVAEMLTAYTDSLYEIGKLEKFQKVSNAILADTVSYAPSNPFIKSARERIAYLKIEIMAGKATATEYLKMEPDILSFKKEYRDSTYSGRIDYLLGLSYLKNKKIDEGKKIFQSILKDEKVSNYIKELVRSELSLLTIKERTL